MTGTSKKRTNRTAAERPAKRRVPPPPGRETMPPPPSFGWIGDIDGLTHGELDQIIRHAGTALKDMAGPMLLPYAAVAYARRENPELYPWSVAGLLMFNEVEAGVLELDEDQAAAEHAAALAASLESGEPMPDPA